MRNTENIANIRNPASDQFYDELIYIDVSGAVSQSPNDNYTGCSINPQLIRKIQTVYKSQLLGIEQSKDEDIHLDDSGKQYPTLDNSKDGETAPKSTNSFVPFKHLKTLQTHQTFGGYDDQDSELQSTPFCLDSYTCFQQGFPPKRAHTSIKVDSYFFYGFNQFDNDNDQYTSDQIINIMPNPYRDNMRKLKMRVRNQMKTL